MKTINSNTKLINKSDIRKAAGLKGPFGSLAASCAMWLMGLNRINRLYPQFGAYHGREFTKEAMKTFRISTDILHEEIEYIPKEGPFIVVSNHPSEDGTASSSTTQWQVYVRNSRCSPISFSPIYRTSGTASWQSTHFPTTRSYVAVSRV